MPISYVCSAKKATVVSASCVGNFTANDHLNLLIAKGNRIEVQLVAPEGLKNVCEIPVYGRITHMKLYRQKNEEKDSIVILTQKLHMAILTYTNGEVTTRAAGNLTERVGRRCEYGMSLLVHSSGLIVCHLYDGFIKVVNLESSLDLKHFNIRYEHRNVKTVEFVETGDSSNYRLAFIHEDFHGRHLEFADFNIKDQELKSVAKQANIASDSSMIIPIPAPTGGVVVLGMDTILYKPPLNDLPVVPLDSTLVRRTDFTCYGKIDKNGERYLLCDEDGRLMMLLLHIAPNSAGVSTVQQMRIELLGETSNAESICYLDNSVVFVGSRFGDSQLCRLNPEPNKDGTFVEVLETFSSVGPIRDMVLVDCDSQSQLITASGDGKDGSLRVIRNGIGIDENASVDLAGVYDLFPLRINSNLDNHLVVAMKEETHVLHINGEELEDLEFMDVDAMSRTLYAGVILERNSNESSVVVQVTDNEIRLMAENATTVMWQPPNGCQIAKVSANAMNGQLVIAAKDVLYYLTCHYKNNELQIDLEQERNIGQEVACIDISNETDDPKKPASRLVCSVWKTLEVHVLALPSLETIITTTLPTNTIARTIIATHIDGINYLLVGIGDGTLLYYVLNWATATLADPKKCSIGTRPPKIQRVRSKGTQHLFVCSDRPVIIFSSNKKLVFSNVNVKSVDAVCSLYSDHPKFRDCLVISDLNMMVFGTVDDIQKIHVRTIPFGETVRKVAHQKITSTYGVSTLRPSASSNTEKSLSASKTALNYSNSKIKTQRADMLELTCPEVSSFLVLDQNTFQVLHSHEFGPFEYIVSLISGQLGADMKSYYIVGTALVYPDENEVKGGRITIFEVDHVEKTKLRRVTDLILRGSPHSLAILNGKLVGSIGGSIRLFDWPMEKELRVESSYFNNTAVIQIKVMGEHLATADMMRSVGILTYRSMEGTIDEIAKDWHSQWMGSCEFITAESVVGSETFNNLFSVEVDKSKTISEDGRYVFDPTGYFYLGEYVNVMARCTLVQPPNDSSITYTHPIMFGTTEGSIGMIVQIEDKWVKFLLAIEKAIADSTKNCLQIDLYAYRQFLAEKKTEPKYGFIDGDVIESILDMDRQKAIDLLSKVSDAGWDESVPRDPSEILKVIEDLARIH